MSYLSVGTILVESEWLNRALSPVVYGDIVLSIKINTQIVNLADSLDSHPTKCYHNPLQHNCNDETGTHHTTPIKMW